MTGRREDRPFFAPDRSIGARWDHVRRRRADLLGSVPLEGNFAAWEESCVPSYCHANPAAALVSWLRLFRAVDLARTLMPDPNRILDFGSSVGELGHLVSEKGEGYDFIEADSQAADFLQSRLPLARRVTIEEAPEGAFDQIFAIDSLEHNDDFAGLIEQLAGKLSARGVLLLCGPTENALYRLGRRVAGFEGHYHKTTIYEIEAAAARTLRRRASRSILPIAPLFRLTAWRR